MPPDDLAPAAPAAPAASVAPRKELLRAYLWWLPPMGFFGAHRFYLRRWYTGSAWAVSSGLLYVGWFVDLFLIPRLVRTSNKQLEKEFAEHPERFAVIERAIAPWAEKETQSLWEKIAEPFNVFWYIVAPAFLVIVAHEAHLGALVPITLVILVAAGFFVTSVDQLLMRHPIIEKVPGVDHALGPFRMMLATYQEHEPTVRRFVRRLFTKETVPYLKILAIVTTGLLVETATTFKEIYQPFLTIEDVGYAVALQLTLVLIAMGLVIIPVFTMSFRYSLSARQQPLRAYTILSMLVVLVIGFGGAYVWNDRDAPTSIASERLILRLEKPDFVRSLRQLTEMFLAYPDKARAETTPAEHVSRLTRFTGAVEEWFDAPVTRSNSAGLAMAYRDLLRNVVPEDETHAFQVERMWDANAAAWRVATYRPDSTEGDTKVGFVIAARDAAGTVYRCDPLLKFAAQPMAADTAQVVDLSECQSKRVMQTGTP